MKAQAWLILGMVLGVIAFVLALVIYSWVKKQDAGTERSKKIAAAIKSGAWAYLRHLYTTLASVAIIFGVILAFIFSIRTDGFDWLVGLETAVAFIIGALCSAIAGYLGMSVAVRANVRTAIAAMDSINKAFNTAYRAGAVLALAMDGYCRLRHVPDLFGDRQSGSCTWFFIWRFITRTAGQGRRRHLHEDSGHRCRPGRQGRSRHSRGTIRATQRL